MPFRLHTEFGGVFYLINAGLLLGLYSDFTMPATPGIELPIWDFLTLLGRELSGEEVESDPVWNLLAALAGRGGDEPPGHTFDAPRSWRVPREWLRPFPKSRCAVSIGERFIVTHPDGFVLLDRPWPRYYTGSEPSQPATIPGSATGATGGSACPDGPNGLSQQDRISGFRSGCPGFGCGSAPMWDRPDTAALSRWTGWIAGYLRARLRLAGVAPDALCRQPAELRISSERIGIAIPLAELPIEIRLAGLDRDPGWVPAAGRFVTFHFE